MLDDIASPKKKPSMHDSLDWLLSNYLLCTQPSFFILSLLFSLCLIKQLLFVLFIRILFLQISHLFVSYLLVDCFNLLLIKQAIRILLSRILFFLATLPSPRLFLHLSFQLLPLLLLSSDFILLLPLFSLHRVKLFPPCFISNHPMGLPSH